MKKFIKHLAVISAIFLVLGTFAACSNDPTPPTTTKVTDLKVAPLVDHATTPIETVVDEDSYTYSAYYNNSAPNTVYVTIKATDLVLHENTNNDKGYWVGIAIPKPAESNWYWRAKEDAAPSSETAFTEQTRTWKPEGSETVYNTFYYCPDDGDFTGKKVYIQLAESAESGVKKTYVITFNVTTKKPYEIGYIKGSGTKDVDGGYKLVDADYPDGKKENGAHSTDWVNDTVWLKFSDVTNISGEYVWMKFVGEDDKHQAAISCGNSIAVNKYSACSFVDTKNNKQWEYLADAMKDDIRTSQNSTGKYEGDYIVYVYAFNGEQTAPTSSETFKTFGKEGTLIGISKITVEKSAATKAAESNSAE